MTRFGLMGMHVLSEMPPITGWACLEASPIVNAWPWGGMPHSDTVTSDEELR